MRKLFVFILLMVSVTPKVFGASEEGLKYKDALKKYHRHGEFFNAKNLHAHIVWDVVYKSPEFRESAARTYAKYYRLTEAELDALLQRERLEAEKGEEFIVVLYTYDRKWNDLEKEDSIWRIRAEVGSQAHEPMSIQKVKPTPIERFMYPYMRPWTTMYSVRFPRGILGPDAFALDLFGVLGHQDLKWEFSK